MGNSVRCIRNWFTRQSSSGKDAYVVNCQTPVTRPAYSWEKRPQIDADQYRLCNIVDQHLHRSLLQPGNSSQSGQQLIVNGCARSLLTVSDGYSDSVFIDDCTECKIVLSPVKGSVFLRNCRDCLVVIAACGQFRTRDCTSITAFLHCASQPSIETSVRLQFNCISIDYPGLREHLAMAGLDPTANLWYAVYDFSPPDEGHLQQQEPNRPCNWRVLAVDECLQDRLTETELLHCASHGFNFDRISSLVPFNHPSLSKIGNNKKLAARREDVSERFYNVVAE